MLEQKFGKKRIILSLSPVRHGKDGAIENSWSKAALRVAIEQLRTRNLEFFYFPTYELMIDDLRDYRYWKEDMLHPTEFAVQYIWKQFQIATMNKATIQLNETIASVMQQINNRPTSQGSAG